jgi:hypothetical protein
MMRNKLCDNAYERFVNGSYDPDSIVGKALNEFESLHIDDDEEPFTRALIVACLPFSNAQLIRFANKGK